MDVALCRPLFIQKNLYVVYFMLNTLKTKMAILRVNLGILI